MYPLDSGEVYPHNEWYIAAWADEVTRTPMERKFLGIPVVLYRTESGEPAALFGLCPHRLYPLIKGELIGDAIKCGYHGITFDKSGKCTSVPSQDEIPSRFATRRFPVIEKGPLIWIWMGEESSADVAKIPDTESVGIGNTAWRFDKVNLYYLNARYQILIDNLMDLSHVPFIHAKTIPMIDDSMLPLPPKMKSEGGRYTVTRNYPLKPVDGFEAFLHPDLAGQMSHQQIVSDYFGPNLIIAGGFYVRVEGTNHTRMNNFMHGITPESPTSTHYFFGLTRNFRLEDDGLSEFFTDHGYPATLEDVSALEAIELNIERFGDVRGELSCRADSGALKVRRLLSAQIKAESAPQ